MPRNGENSSRDMKFDDEKFLIRRFVVVVAKLFDLLKKGVLKQHSDNFVSIFPLLGKLGQEYSKDICSELNMYYSLLVLLCTATNSLQAIGHFMALRFSYSGVAFYLLTQHNTCYPPVVAVLIVAKDGEKAIC